MDYKEVLEKIRDYVEYKSQAIEIFKNNRLLFKLDRYSKLKDYIKNNIEKPTKDRKIWIVTYVIDYKSKNPFKYGVQQMTITLELELVRKSDDKGKVITYTPEDIITYGFKRANLKKVFKAIRERKISIGVLDTQNYGKLLRIINKDF